MKNTVIQNKQNNKKLRLKNIYIIISKYTYRLIVITYILYNNIHIKFISFSFLVYSQHYYVYLYEEYKQYLRMFIQF